MNQAYARSLLLIIAVLIPCATTQSAVISADFHQAGDGLLTYDTINEREWLDLSQSGGWSLSDTKLALASAYRGFHIATVSDVTAFVTSAGYDRTSNAGEPYFSIATELIDLLNQDLTVTITASTSDGAGAYDKPMPTGDFGIVTRYADAWASHDSSSEFFDDFVISTTTPEQTALVSFGSANTSTAGIQPTDGSDPLSISQYRSVWLYRDVSVPEPTSFAILTGVLCTAIPFRRCR